MTTKVRYPDFAIRSRSTTLPAGPTTASGSASSPARSSTARSATGPGALRLVGVGVSGLEPHRQLALV